jgi:hypothetical protein
VDADDERILSLDDRRRRIDDDAYRAIGRYMVGGNRAEGSRCRETDIDLIY